ncbi:uncharacterized protein METZ01_LOCUS7428 [marine metagenome]|uniref:Uncharacterized protein n=1 Tax=marine metagenome TaxID=408172 RepID=A0A381NKC4_9ZZZZ
MTGSKLWWVRRFAVRDLECRLLGLAMCSVLSLVHKIGPEGVHRHPARALFASQAP